MSGDTYSSARGFSAKDATIAAATVRDLTKEHGRLDTKELAKAFVEASKAKTSPTHHLFEWDDRKAAAAHRMDRAMQIISAVLVVFEEQPEQRPVRAFPVLTVDGKKGPYPMREALKSVSLTASMLEAAKRDMLIFKKKYDGLRELADVFAAMGDILEPAAKPKAKKTRGRAAA